MKNVAHSLIVFVATYMKIQWSAMVSHTVMDWSHPKYFGTFGRSKGNNLDLWHFNVPFVLSEPANDIFPLYTHILSFV